MRKTIRTILLALIVSASTTAFAQSPTKLPTPPEVWAKYDPDAGDFKEEIISEETKDGIYRRDSYISAYVNGEEIRVFCKYAVKAGATNAPGLMNVHGWMASPGINEPYVKDGWAVMAHDYCGETGSRTQFTKYPPAMKYGNMDAKTGYRVKEKLPDGKDITDPAQTDDYLWYAIQRRVLSYLLAQKEVDKSRIGGIGYSYGGSLMWNLAMDERVKAVVAFFGIGWNNYYRNKRVWLYDVPPTNPPKTPGEELLLSAIEPQAHAPHIKAACLWLSGTNDHHGGHERSELIFKMFQPGVPWSFALQARAHHDTSKLGNDAKAWLEKYVLGKDIDWPARPKTEIRLDAQGVPELVLTPQSLGTLESVEGYYALKDPVSFSRFWRDAKLERQGDIWVAKLPVSNVDDYVFAFANLRYQGDIVISSDFTAAIPSKLGQAVATKVDTQDGSDFWSEAGPVEGVGGVKGLRALNNQTGTFCEHFSGVPERKAPSKSVMDFRFYCTQPLTIIMEANNQFAAEIEITASNDWQAIKIPASRLISKSNGTPFADWSLLANLRIRPKPGSDITQMVFVDPKWEGGVTTPAPSSNAQQPKSAQPEVATPDASGRVFLTPGIATSVQNFLPVQKNLAITGVPISIGGQKFERGLGVHAPSKIVFPLEGKYTTFHVVPGPDDSHAGTMEMKILVDDKQVWTSSQVSKSGYSPTPLDLPVTGAKTLTLIVEECGEKGGDHASWGDAYLQSASKQ
jgi:dienelactone hydrolase